MSNVPQLGPLAESRERNWMPMAIAAAVVLVVAGAVVLALEHGRGSLKVTPISASLDPYAASLPLTNLAMSESSNLAGGKVTYLDGHIANKGGRTISGVTVQVLFRNAAHEVAQNETQAIKLIRMREPYIDVEPLSAAPLKPGADSSISPDWDGAYPDLRIIRVESPK
jgi:hypothetical protein